MTEARRIAAERMLAAASEFLGSLTAAQREIAAWPFDTAERETWFYTPTDHGGVRLGDLSPAQYQKAMKLLASGSSAAAYVTASTIIGLDNVLDYVEGYIRDWGRERGRDVGAYYIRVFGEPGSTGTWSWRMGGHHLSVNHLIVDGAVASTTPFFLGADPASAPLLGPHPSRPLAGAEDLGRELTRSLSDAQRILGLPTNIAPVDLVSANRPHFGQGEGDLPIELLYLWRGVFPGELGQLCKDIHIAAEKNEGTTTESLELTRLTAIPKGLPASSMTVAQREILRALLDVYIGRIPDELAADERAKYAADADLDRLHFLWAGGLDQGQGHYYRVQGDTFLAELDNTARGANHVHTVWRDLTNDFGADVLADHYRASH